MKQIELSCGFTAVIDERKITDDYRFVRLFKNMSRAKEELDMALHFDDMLSYVLGDEQTENLIDHLVERDGHAGYSEIEKALTEIFNGAAGNEELKK